MNSNSLPSSKSKDEKTLYVSCEKCFVLKTIEHFERGKVFPGNKPYCNDCSANYNRNIASKVKQKIRK